MTIREKASIPPQRFRWLTPGTTRWRFGACLYALAFDLWEIHTFGHQRVMTFEEDPWEILGQVIGDVDKFEWIDNEMEWHG